MIEPEIREFLLELRPLLEKHSAVFYGCGHDSEMVLDVGRVDLEMHRLDLEHVDWLLDLE